MDTGAKCPFSPIFGPGWRRHAPTAALLGLSTIVLLVTTSPDIGLTWDEPAYIVAAESYVSWIVELFTRPDIALSESAIEYYWQPNHEHPPLDKVWSGLVWHLAKFVFDDLTARRFGNILLSGALISLSYAMVATTYGRRAGLVAAGALITMPRFFLHAHLASLDVPIALATFVVVLLFWRTRDRPERRWDVWLGVAWGLAMTTKVSAIVVPPILLLWIFCCRPKPYLFRRLVMMTLIGLPLSLALWPWLYHEFPDWLAWYILFVTIDHWEIGQWYLGRLYIHPPWHFAFVTAIAVVPLALMILCILGILRTARERRGRETGLLFLLCALMPMVVLAVGRTGYDNDRLFMPSFPYIAALAGLGFDWAVPKSLSILQRAVPNLAKPSITRLLALVIAGLTFAPHIVQARDLYPHLLSYYSATVGGLPGATRLGLETTYWCETYAQAIPYLNAHANPEDIIWVQDWSHDVLIYYQLQGTLRRDLSIARLPYSTSVFRQKDSTEGVSPPQAASIEDAHYVLLQYRQTGFTDSLVSWLQGRTPVYRLAYRGVPLMEIYAHQIESAASQEGADIAFDGGQGNRE